MWAYFQTIDLKSLVVHLTKGEQGWSLTLLFVISVSQSETEKYFGGMIYLVISSVARDKINFSINMSWEPFL